MLKAIAEARKNLVRADGGPFGAAIVKDGRVVAAARNTVLRDDATAHAEINAIRKASKTLGTFDLGGCEIYSTTEPCPCASGPSTGPGSGRSSSAPASPTPPGPASMSSASPTRG